MKGELAESSARTEERAHNQIVLDEAELATLAREGFDLERPRGLLKEARAAFDRRDFHRALQTSKSVHDSLVKLRRSGALVEAEDAGGAAPSALRGPVDRASPTLEGPLSMGGIAALEGSTTRAAIPKNRMEARFQLTLLTDELVEAVRTQPNDGRVAEANRLAAEAKALEERSEYTDALRLALRARRALGGKVETLPPGTLGLPSVPAPRGSGRVGDSEGPPRSDAATGPAPPGPSSNPTSAHGFGECPSCHRPVRPGDAFCRSCGTAVLPAKCPRCGATLEPDDRFCPRCGSPSA
ncbi:MAG TPA: zinc ribbon domain-containing protein [Thermoplasmata archaeon]|nr:zinc ribbon domain-containing protein [Thermoplasmata archaeon]